MPYKDEFSLPFEEGGEGDEGGGSEGTDEETDVWEEGGDEGF